VDIRRFGPGHRRPDGPPGTRGVSGQVIQQDARGSIVELAFGPRAALAPHTNPNTTYFVVISGGGFAQVGDERVAVNHGEAVVWPAGEPHAAWTEGTEMRAIVVEFAGEDDAWARAVLAGGTTAARASDAGLDPGPGEAVPPGRGALVTRDAQGPDGRDESSGEPW
jgi:quercetin dioxygenase-like cupin family protein